MNDVLRKNLYKIFLSIVKFLPIILSCFQIVLTVCNYLGRSVPLVTYVGGSSFIFIGLLFIMSYVFQFCYLYRIPLWYITIIGLINVLRYLNILSISLLWFYQIIAIITGAFMVLFIYYMYKNRHKPKIDHIKQLCENYANCCK
jgi:hypothetical protein